MHHPGKFRCFFVVSRDAWFLSSYVLLPGTFIWFFRACPGLRRSLYGHAKSVFWHGKLSSCWPLLRPSVLESFRALSDRVSHTRGWGEVSFSFVPGLVAKTQDTSSLAPRFEGFPVQALRTRDTFAMGDCYVLCRRTGVT